MFIEDLLSPIGKEIWELLDYPDEWIYDETKRKRYCIIHKETKICLWVCNGRWFLDGYYTSVFRKDEEGYIVKLFDTIAPEIGLIERHILWSKAKMVDKFLKNESNTNEDFLNSLKSYNESRKNYEI